MFHCLSVCIVYYPIYVLPDSLTGLLTYLPIDFLTLTNEAPPEQRIKMTHAPFSASALPHYTLFERPSLEAVDAFQKALRARGVWTSVRAARGDEECAACGQLATRHARTARGSGSL